MPYNTSGSNDDDDTDTHSNTGNVNTMSIEDMFLHNALPEAAVFAVNHLKSLLWSTGRSLQRDRLQWSADVRMVFRGFDNGGTGFISTEDFALALKLLNAPVNADILRDIPQMPDGPGLVAYQPILDYCLANPSQNQDGDISGGTSVDQLGSIHANHRMTLSASTTDAITKGTTKSTPAVDTALTKLANVVRRASAASVYCGGQYASNGLPPVRH